MHGLGSHPAHTRMDTLTLEVLVKSLLLRVAMETQRWIRHSPDCQNALIRYNECFQVTVKEGSTHSCHQRSRAASGPNYGLRCPGELWYFNFPKETQWYFKSIGHAQTDSSRQFKVSTLVMLPSFLCHCISAKLSFHQLLEQKTSTCKNQHGTENDSGSIQSDSKVWKVVQHQQAPVYH